MRRAAADDLSGDGGILESNGHVARLAHQRHRAGSASDDRRARVHADPRPELQPVSAAELGGEGLHLVEDRHGRVRRSPSPVLVGDRVSEAEQETLLVALHHGPVEAARRPVARLLKATEHPRLVLGIEALEVSLGFEHLAAADENGDLAALGLGGDAPGGRRRGRPYRDRRTTRRPGPRRRGLHDALGLREGRLLQRDDDLLGGLETLLRRLLETTPDDPVERRRNVRPDAERSAGSSVRIAAMVSAGVSFRNACRPDSSS